MRHRLVLLTLAVVLLAASSFVMATAEHDVRVDREKDDDRNTIIKLVNSGAQPVLANVEHKKKCGSVTTNQPPRVRTYLVNPGKSIQLRKVWSESSCEHSFRILEARYHQAS